MATATRIYTVTDGEQKRLVRASHPNTALMHVARDRFKVAVATHNELEELLPTQKVEHVAQEQRELPAT